MISLVKRNRLSKGIDPIVKIKYSRNLNLLFHYKPNPQR